MKHKLFVSGAVALALAGFVASESAGQKTDRSGATGPKTQAPAATSKLSKMAKTSATRASAIPSSAVPTAPVPSPAVKEKVVQEYGRLPLSFEANQGQTDSRVKFLSRGPGYQLFLLPDEAVLTVQQPGKIKSIRDRKRFGDFSGIPRMHERQERELGPLETIRMSLVGAGHDVTVTGVDEMPGKSNYFVGNDPAKWHTNVANFAQVRYRNVYPGVDLIYHGSRQQLEYDFVVAPGADPRQIQLRVAGAQSLTLTPEGDALLATSGEPVRLHKPVLYQEFGGKRKEIAGEFVLAAKDTVAFWVGAYDRSRELVIDPVLVVSTPLGGDNFDQGLGIAVDAAGAAYVSGSTMSSDFHTTGAFQTTLQNCGTTAAPVNCEVAFIAKLTFVNNVPSLSFVTYVGGTGFSQADAVAVVPGSSNGNVYAAGETVAHDFPTTDGTTLKGTENAFLAILNPTGSALVFSDLFGGGEATALFNFGGPQLAVDVNGNAYVTGSTTSGDFLTTAGVLEPTSGGGFSRTTDSTTTWTGPSFGTTPPAFGSGLKTPNITAIVVDPETPADVYVATASDGVFKSADNGTTWIPINGSGTTALGSLALNTLAIDPATTGLNANLYAGSFAGAFKSTNGGTAWSSIGPPLTAGTTTNADVHAFAIIPSNATTTPPTPAIIYAGGFDGLFKSLDGGSTWTSQNANFPVGTFADVTSLVVDPTNPNIIYAGTSTGVFKTVNGGTTWLAASNGLTRAGSSTLLGIQQLAIDAKATPQPALYAAIQGFASDGIFKSADGGNSWTAVNGAGSTAIADRIDLSIVADPTASGTVYVGSASTGVLKTTDGGNTWITPASNSLSNYLIGALAIDPTHSATLYAGSPVQRAFVTKFSASGNVVYSTYLGGSAEEFSAGVAADAQGDAYVTGTTLSRNFPSLNAFRATRQSAFDAFVTELDPQGSQPVYSTYLDGNTSFSEGFGIAVDSAGSAYVTGITGSSNFPTTAAAFQTVFNGGDAGFVTKFNPIATPPAPVTLAYSTFLESPAGSANGQFVEPTSIAVDTTNNSTKGSAWLSGFTNSLNFPIANPIRATLPCESNTPSDCFFGLFISELDPAGATLPFSTLFGPSDTFVQSSLALDSQGSVYTTGTISNSSDFPAVNPLTGPPTPAAGSSHAFLSKIANTAVSAVSTDLAVTLTHPAGNVTVGNNLVFTATITNNGPSTATGVTLFPTQAPTSTLVLGDPIHLFKQLVTETATQGTCDSNEFCFLGTMASGATITVTLTVSVVSGDEGKQTVAVGVGGNESDSNPANNVATDTVTVVGGVDLQLNGSTSPLPAVAGGPLTYTLFVTNKSGNPASNVTLTDTLPAGFSATSTTPTTPTCTIAATIVSCLLGTVAGGATTSVAITGTAPATPGTITNNVSVTASEAQTSPGDNMLTQITDVVTATGANNPLNARLKGPYAIRFGGVNGGALMAFIGEFIADGLGGINTGVRDINSATGVTQLQPFTGSYNVGEDNRITFTIVSGAQTQTFRGALGVLDSNNVAGKVNFIEFDTSGQTGFGIMEPQQTNAFSTAVIGTGSFAFRQAGENSAKIHFAVAGQLALTQTTPGQGTAAGTLDSNLGGTVSAQIPVSGTFTLAQTGQANAGHGTLALSLQGGTQNYSFVVVSANEVYLISTDTRTATVPMSGGVALRQRVLAFSNGWLNGTGVFNLSGVTSTGATVVHLGILTGNAAGSVTVLSDENNAGTITANNQSTGTYAVSGNGRTPIVAGPADHPPTIYLYDLNAGFLVGTDVNASSGRLEQQAAPPLSDATASGPFFLSTYAPDAPGLAVIIGEGSISGTGSFSFTQDGTTAGLLINDQLSNGTYAVALNGRTPLGDNSVAYIVAPSKIYSIGAKAGKTNDTIVTTETGTQPSIDLAVTGPTTASVAAGAQLTLTYTVTNLSTIPGTGILLSDLLPISNGFTFISATPSQGACNGVAQVLCSLGSIAAGATASVTYVVTAPATVATGTITNQATVSEGSVDPPVVDPNLANNAVTTSVTVTVTATGCSAGTTQWSGAAGDNQWGNANNWVGGAIPTAASNVCIGTAFASSAISIGALAATNQTIASLNANSTINFTAGPLTVSGTATFVNPVNLTGGILTLNGASALQSTLNVSGGTLTGSGTATLTGLLTWSGGTISGAGVFNANGGTNITGSEILDTRTLNVAGATTFASANGAQLTLQNGATINNLAGSTWNIVTGQSSGILLNGATTGSFNNAGTFQFNGRGFTFGVNPAFTNTGTVSSNSGALMFTSAYTQTGSNSATLLNGGTILNGSPSILPINIDGGKLGGSGGIAGDVFVTTGGVLSPGLPGLISLSGTYTQSTTGSYLVEIAGLTAGTQYDELNDTAANTSVTLGGTLNVTLLNNFIPAVGNSFTIINCTAGPCINGTFGTINFPALPAGLVWNIAYNPSSVVLNVVNASAGCATGTTQWTGAGGDNQWSNPNNWAGGAIPSAASNVCIGTAFANSTITIGALAAANQTIASLNANSTINFTNGPLTVSGATTFVNTINLTGGTLTLNGTSTMQGQMTLTGTGTLAGTGSVTITGLLTWSQSSTMSGAGITNANGGMNVQAASIILDTRTLNVTGTTSFGNGGQGSSIAMRHSAVINNLAGGTWNFANSNINNHDLSAPVFNNAGSFQALATGGGLNGVNAAFNNTGTMDSNSGQLIFTAGYTQTAGTTLLNGGSIAASNGTNFNINGGKLAGNGALTGNVSVTTGGLLSPGFSPGLISLSGPYTQSATGSYLVEIAGLTAGTQYDQLNVAANDAVTLGGTLNVTLLNGFVPAAGNTFTIIACAGVAPCINGTTFAATNFPALPAGLIWAITYNPTSVVVSVNANAGADLAVTKIASVNTTHLGGGNFTYSLTAKNNGPQDATAVTITDPLPPAVTLVSVTPAGACTGTTTLTCVIGNLANGTSSVITVTVTPAAAGSATNTATITGTQSDPNPGNNSSTATVQITGTADVSIVKTGAATINAGTPLTYTLTVANAGPSTATNVLVTDALPAGAAFVSSNTPQGTCTGTTTITCNLGSINANSNVVVTIVVTPTGPNLSNTATVSATEFDPNTANNTSTLNTTVVPVADLAVTASASPNPDGVNSALTITATVTNNGPSPATGVTLSNVLPAGATFVSANSTQGTCTAAISCAIGTLAKVATATVTIVITPTATGNLTDTAIVAGNEADPNQANNTASVTVPITASSDLAVTKTVGSPILLGNNLTYTITVMNNGPSTAPNITLTDTLPANVTFVGTTPGAGITCPTPAGAALTCTIATLANTASAQVLVVVKPNAAGNFTNTVAVASPNFDPNQANNTASATGVVTAAADLSLSVAAPQSAFVGDTVALVYTIQNAGPSNATGVTLRDALPAGLTFVSSTPPVCSGAAQVTCNVGNLAAAGNAQVSISVKVGAAGTITNTANVSANETDPNPENNNATNTLVAAASADLALTASGAPNPATVNNNVMFTVTATNNGPSPATNVQISGTVAGAVTLVSISPAGNCTGNLQFTCTFQNLAASAAATITIVVTPIKTGNAVITANVTANEHDPVPANDSATFTVTVVDRPTVILSPSSLNFSSQPLNTLSASQQVTLTNASPVLAVSSLVISVSGDFSETDNCGTGLAPQASCVISVGFKPTATGTRTGTVSLTDNALGSPQTIGLTGVGINAPAITLVPTSVTFSSQRVGVQSAAQPVTLTNSGNATLNITSISVSGANPGDFSETNNCGSTLAAGSGCTISVSFKPTAGGQRTAGLSISTNAPGSVPVVTLSGTGVAPGLDLSPSLLAFDNQVVGTTSAQQTVILSNAAATAISLTIGVSGDFSQTNNCGSSIAASSNCAIQVKFTPTAVGPRTGTLSVTGSDSATPHTISLSGNGVVVTLSLSPASLIFNNQKTGTTSQSQAITLTNTGGGPLTIDSVITSGDFLQTNNCGTTVAAGVACTINVSFSPTLSGTRTGSITITSNAQGSPHTVGLSGTGVDTASAVVLSCSSAVGSSIRANVRAAGVRGQNVATTCAGLSFPSEAVGVTSSPQTVTLTNVGNEALSITGASASGDYAISSNTCPQSLGAGSSCSIGITFTPTATGTRSGALSVTDNAGDSPQLLGLTGTGTPSGPAITLSSNAIPFGDQMVGTTSGVQTVTVTNPGNAQVTFSNITVSGDFAKTADTCSPSLAANGSCSISVTFTPSTTGGRAGAITISDNAPGSPQAVTLSGNGTDIVISIPAGGSSSASISAGQSATFALTLAPAGGFSGTVTATCTGTIPGGTCTSSPSSFTLNSVMTVTTTVTTSEANAMVAPPLTPTSRPGSVDFARSLLRDLVVLLALLALTLAVRFRRRAWALAASGILLVSLSSSLAGCAGGSDNPGVQGRTTGTPAGAYSITVVITTSSGTTRSFPLSVTVH